MKVCSWAMYAQIARKFPKTDSVKARSFEKKHNFLFPRFIVLQIYYYHYCSSPSPLSSSFTYSDLRVFQLRINFWKNSAFKNFVGLPGRRKSPSQGHCLHTTATTQIYIMTCIPIARQRLGKHIPAQSNSLNNRTSIARQNISKHMSLTIEAVFSVASLQIGYKEVFGSTEVESEVKGRASRHQPAGI
jgi:hypothetical protein